MNKYPSGIDPKARFPHLKGKYQGHVHPRRNEDGELNWEKEGTLTRPTPYRNEKRLEVQRQWMREQEKRKS